MNKQLDIGISGKTAFTLPPDVQTTTLAVLGIRGSGKTSTATVVVEELLDAGYQVVIIDPTDVWWGLRSSADGQAPGVPIAVCGGDHGQVQLAATDGAALAELVATERYSLVLSLRHLRKGDQRHLVTDFAETLYHAKGKTRTPLLVVIDECDAFIPQRVGGAEARMVGAIEDLVRRGRAAGIGVCLISQRAASVNKDVLTQLELLVAHRHTSPQDRKALEAWVEAHDVGGQRETFMRELAALPRGTAWFWSPGWLDVFARVAVRRRRTFDSSATPTTAGVQHAPAAMAEVDLVALQAKLAATVQAAEENDPKRLRARIQELEEQRTASGTGIDPACLVDEINAAVQKRDAEWHALWITWTAEVGALAGELFGRLNEAIGKERHPQTTTCALPADFLTNGTWSKTATVQLQSGMERAGKELAGEADRGFHAKVSQDAAPANGTLNAYQRDLLGVLLDRSPVPTPRGQLGGLAGRSIKSSAFAPNLRALIGAGYVEDTGRGYVATPAAQRALGDHRPPPRTGKAALAYWLGRLPAYEASLLRALAEVFPKSQAVEQLSARAQRSHTSSAFMPALRNLVQLGHVEPDAGGYRAARHFFVREA